MKKRKVLQPLAAGVVGASTLFLSLDTMVSLGDKIAPYLTTVPANYGITGIGVAVLGATTAAAVTGAIAYKFVDKKIEKMWDKHNKARQANEKDKDINVLQNNRDNLDLSKSVKSKEEIRKDDLNKQNSKFEIKKERDESSKNYDIKV